MQTGGRISGRGATKPDGTPLPARGVPAHQHPTDSVRFTSVWTRGQRVVLAILIAVWVAASLWFWIWWFDPEHWLSTAGLLASTTLLFMTFVAPAWLIVGIWQASRPMTRPDPRTRVAMIVTKAPSEPFALVRRTLEAMLAQAYPYPYDVWLADERPDEESVEWCRTHGVSISTRDGVDEYHRESWPRRTRCKEGNLAYFYDRWGYNDYDVVCQFDADHVPEPDYLWFVLSAFSDRSVAFVAAPNICDANSSRSWAARGRVDAEAVLHGPTQAGHVQQLAPMCFGSHYAVRTEPLRRAGGLGPELAEDFTTTMALLSEGFQGGFAIDAVAHGDGPEDIGDAVSQEHQWAASMARVYLDVAPMAWHQLDRRSKVKMGFGLVWYPLLTVHMILAHALVIAAVMTDSSWVHIPVDQFLLHRILPLFAMTALVGYARRLGVLRPKTAKVISWESALFSLVRWPWIALGVLQGAAGSLLERDLGWRVTPKGSRRPLPIDLRTMTPHAVLVAILAGCVMVRPVHPDARGYAILALAIAVMYVAAMALTLALHLHENPGLDLGGPLGAVAGIVGLSALVAVTVGWRWDDLFPPGAEALTNSDTWEDETAVRVFLASLCVWAAWMIGVANRRAIPRRRSRTTLPGVAATE